LLFLQDKIDGPAQGRMSRVKAESCKGFQPASGDVGCARIDHRIVIRKWNLSQALFAAVTIERAPSSILVLHRQYPAERALHGLTFPVLVCFVGELNLAQSSEDLKSVVRVRIEFIGIFKEPATRLSFRILKLPVPRDVHLLR